MYIRQKLLENVALTDKHTSVLTVPRHTKDVTTAKCVVNIRNVYMCVLNQQYTSSGQSGKKPFTVPLFILKGKIFLSFYDTIYCESPTRSKGNDFITIRPLFISGDFVNLGGKTTTKTFIHRNKIHVFHGCLKPLQKRLRIFSKQSSEKLFSSLRPQV